MRGTTTKENTKQIRKSSLGLNCLNFSAVFPRYNSDVMKALRKHADRAFKATKYDREVESAAVLVKGVVGNSWAISDSLNLKHTR